MKKLILVDDHKLLRKGISAYILENSDWQIELEAKSLEELMSSLENFTFSPEDSIVAVVDLQLSNKEGYLTAGFEAVKFLSKKNIPSIIFSSHDTGACIERAISADVGAKGYVSKVSDEEVLLKAINTVAEGKSYIQPDLISGLLAARSLFSMLSKREAQVTSLIQDGLSNEEIAEEMGIKLTTLENYLSIIYDKTGCRDRNSLLAKLS